MAITFKALRSRWTPIGVDLGVSGVRLAQARRDGDRLVIVSAAQTERSLGAKELESKDVADSQWLVDCMSKAQFNGRMAVAALSAPDLSYHALELPRAALDAGADDLVRIEVERLATRASADFEVRHWRIPETQSTGPNALAVEVGAECINKAVDLCASGKLDCLCVEPAATALVRFANLIRPRESKLIRGVLDLGERQTRLIVYSDDTPLLVRTTGTGGRSWTQRISEALRVTFRNAEIHKRTHGICRTGTDGASDGESENRSELPAMLLGALRLDLTELAAEVKRSFEYVLGCHPSCRAGDLMLVGGGALLGNLPSYLGHALGIEVAAASDHARQPDAGIVLPSSMRDPIERFALAVGLAAGENA